MLANNTLLNPIKAFLNVYYFDISKPEQSDKYDALCRELESQKIECFNVYASANNIKDIGESREILINYLFENQYNTTDGLHVFDWYEVIYSNKNTKSGYYISDRDELDRIKSETKKCNYCGKQYRNTTKKFCLSCIGSEYLKPENYANLRLTKLSETPTFTPLTEKEKAFLIPRIEKAQAKRLREKAKKVKRVTIARLRNDVRVAKLKLFALTWFLRRGIDTDNLIYYSYTSVFTFGWRSPVSVEEKNKILDIISEFPYTYEIKAVDGNYTNKVA